jgi:ribosome-binding protein aMBF1 (putative translation factor)
MSTKTKPNPNVAASKSVTAKRITVKGKRMVQMDEAEFDRLLHKADEFEPQMPPLNANGNYPALEAVRVNLAISILRHRRKLGLSQAELARRAGIRPELLNRIEQGHVDPSIRTIKKIDHALSEAERG